MLDRRDVSILNALPASFKSKPSVLTIGAGGGRLEYHMILNGLRVLATDLDDQLTDAYRYEFDMSPDFSWMKWNILDPIDDMTLKVMQRDVVICSEVLEHLEGWRQALENLISLANERVIITIPVRHSFSMPGVPAPQGHCNFWAWKQDSMYMGVRDFIQLALPYSCAISEIKTKDNDPRQSCFLIVIDKTQNLYV